MRVLPRETRKKIQQSASPAAEERQTQDAWFSRRYLAEMWAKPPAKMLSMLSFLIIGGLLIYVFAANSETTSLPLGSGVTNNTTVSNGQVTLSTAPTQPPGMSLVFDDEFDGSALSSSWAQYNGTEGPCCPDNVWRSYNLVVSGGYLHMITKKDSAGIIGWTSAGTSMGKSLNQTHGEWDVRIKAQKAKGVGFAMLLWPQTGGTPPELDFDEEGPSDGTTRSLLTATTHYSGGQLHHKENLDLTQWHTIGVKWTSGEVDYQVDGVTWAKDTTGVPNVPMHLALQAEVGKKGSDNTVPDSTTPNPNEITVDWVHIYH